MFAPCVTHFSDGASAEVRRQARAHEPEPSAPSVAEPEGRDPQQNSPLDDGTAAFRLEQLKFEYRRTLLLYRMFERSRRDVALAARELDAMEQQAVPLPSSTLRVDVRTVPAMEKSVIRLKNNQARSLFNGDHFMSQLVCAS